MDLYHSGRNLKTMTTKHLYTLTTIFVLISFMILSLMIPGGLFVSSQTVATYYVAKNGSDSNPGIESQPWLTLKKAADTLAAGETVYVKAGIIRNS